MTRACIHLTNHNHLVVGELCRRSFYIIFGFFAQLVAQISTTKFSTVTLVISKEFHYIVLIHTKLLFMETLCGDTLMML
jgi:hypothetical protein